jgi:hypothetical protein
MYDRGVERSRTLTAVRLASVIVVVAAIVTQAIVLANADAFDPTRFFAFFTILSNLVGVAASPGCWPAGTVRDPAASNSCAARPLSI